MSSKEVQLAISFGGALAALILISAPVNETIAFGGSGAALLLSSGFFYGGMKNFFAEREQREQQTREVVTQNFQRLIDAQTRTENFYRDAQKFFVDSQQREQQTREVITENFQRLIDAQSSAEKQRQEIYDELANLSDVVKDFVAAPLAAVPDTLANISAQVKILNNNAENIDRRVDKLKKLIELTEDLADEIKAVAQNVDKIVVIKDALQNLEHTINRQEEFYKAALNQYNEMNGRDVELIETLARKLR